MRSVRPGEWAASLVVGAILSASWCYPAYHAASLAGGMTQTVRLVTAGRWAVHAILFGLVFLAFYEGLGEAFARGDDGGSGKVLSLRLTPRGIALASLVVFVCWLPWIVLMQPVSMAADTVAQILWARGYPVWDPSSRELLGAGYVMSDHHPVFDTLIYGFFDKIGRHLFGSEAVGFSIHGMLQAALTATCAGAMVCYLRDRLGAPRPVALASLAFFALVPVFGCMTQVMLKDLTSMPFFMAWLLCFVEYVVRRRRDEEVGRRLVVALVVLGVLGALTRKTLLYIELGSLLVALVALPGKRSLVLPIVVPLLVMQVLLARMLFPLLGVANGGTQEVLGVPLQQSAYTYLVHGDTMSASDLEVIGRVIDLESVAANYEASGVDHIKDRCFRRDCSRSDLIAYLGVWAKEAFLYPDSYSGAVNYLTEFFVPGMVDSEGFYTRTGWPEYGGNDILPDYPAFEYGAPPSATDGQTACMQVVFVTLPSIPVVGLVLMSVLYNLWLPVSALAVCILRRAKGAALALVPLLLSLAVILVCPAAQARYGFNLLYCAPLVAFLPFCGGVFGDRGRTGAKIVGE